MGDRTLIVGIASLVRGPEFEAKVLKWPKLVLGAVLLSIAIRVVVAPVCAEIISFYESQIFAHA